MITEENKLDNPVWNSLLESHEKYALDYNGAKFYNPDYCPFGGFTELESTLKSTDEYAKEGNSILRPIHYPPITDEPKDGAVRAAAHGDINLITLLMGAQGKGLQVQNHDGQWIDAMAEPDELMINVGDMLSRHTNNKLKSTIHQVVNPPRELWGTSRFSIPFFMHPVSDMKLNCLEQCIDADNPKLYDDITAGEFLDERLVELGLKKK